MESTTRRRLGRGWAYPGLLSLLTALAIAIAGFGVSAAVAAAPTVSLDPPGTPSYTSVPVSGTIDPKDNYTYYAFEVSTDGTNWSGFTSLGPLAPDSGSQPVSDQVSSLKPNTEYQLRLVANNFVDPEVISAGPNPTFKTKALPDPSVSIKPVTAVTDRTAHFSGTIDPEAPAGDPAASDVTFRFECTPACPGIENMNPVHPFENKGFIPADSASHEVSADVSGLEPNLEYSVTLIAENANGPTSSSTIPFKTEGVPPLTLTMPAFALAGGTKAVLGGRINPENDATTYWFEYGLDDSYGSSFPAAEDGTAGGGGGLVFVDELVSGLQPGATYHYRLVTKNAFGTVEGEDLTFVTPTGSLGPRLGAFTLPDNRAWEMVSPPDKLAYDVGRVHGAASRDGERLMFKSMGSFVDQPTSKAGAGMDYISQRGTSSWETHGIEAFGGAFSFTTGFQLLNEELTEGLMIHNDMPGEVLDPNYIPGSKVEYGNAYRRDLPRGAYHKLPNGYIGLGEFAPRGDLRYGLFVSNEKLTPDSPCNGGGNCLYELDEHNGRQVKLGSVLPGEVPSEVGSLGYIDMSENGRAYWFTGPGNVDLYVRMNGQETLQVNESQRTTPPTNSPEAVRVVKATPSGDKLLLEGEEQLVDADEDGFTDLYLWDGSKPAGERLSLVTKGDFFGTKTLSRAGASGDLNRVYFTTDSRLLTEDPQTGEAGLYLWEGGAGEGSVKRVATVADPAGIFMSSEVATAHTSPDGRYNAFVSTTRLTGYDNAGQAEVYLYDSVTDRLTCVSCDPRNRPAQSPGRFNVIEPVEAIFNMNNVLQSVSPAGEVFFETQESLVPRDVNGVFDVYAYTGGLPYLISSGQDNLPSRMIDASVDGRDVFFTTAERLLRWDVDNNTDAYDARIGGGLPEAPLAVGSCEGDACQPPPNPPNDPTPASSSFNGAGNVKPQAKKPCKKAKAKKQKKKCQKKKHKKKSKQKSTKKNG